MIKKLSSATVISLFLVLVFAGAGIAQSQLTPEDRVIFYTLEWEGERDQYGLITLSFPFKGIKDHPIFWG